MCSCEPGWTCPRCRDTPSDHRYELDEWTSAPFRAYAIFGERVYSMSRKEVERFTEQDA